MSKSTMKKEAYVSEWKQSRFWMRDALESGFLETMFNVIAHHEKGASRISPEAKEELMQIAASAADDVFKKAREINPNKYG